MDPSRSRSLDGCSDPAAKKMRITFREGANNSGQNTYNNEPSTSEVSSEQNDLKRKLEEVKKEVAEALKSLRDQLKCAVCLALLSPNTVLCVNGHNICKNCQGRQDKCPLCRTVFSNVKQNLVVGQVLAKLPVFCDHENCLKLIKPWGDNRDDHEVYCSFRPTECKHTGCSWSGPVNELCRHIVEIGAHSYHRVLNEVNDRLVVAYAPGESFKWARIFSFFGHLLWQVASNVPATGLLTFSYFPVFIGKPSNDFFVRLSFRSHKKEYTVGIKISSDSNEWDEYNIVIPISILHNYIDTNIGSLVHSLWVEESA